MQMVLEAVVSPNVAARNHELANEFSMEVLDSELTTHSVNNT
jgi:hypothetical protein